MPYINDVFISYKRGRMNEEWLDKIFLPLFTEYLNDELPYEPRIFVDKTALTPGVDFNNELFKNLLYSKCMVSIISPPYFRKSEWCVKEFLTMKHRQERFKLDSFTTPKALIWPVLYREVEPLPAIMKNLSYLDYSEFNLVGEAFFKTEKYLKLQEKLQDDIKTIAAIISKAPELTPEWETPEGRQQVLAELNAYLEENCDVDVAPTQKAILW